MIKILNGIDFGDNVTEVRKNEECKVLKIQNETGEGIMTIYDVFPGAVIMFNDFRMSYCKSEFQANTRNLLCIDHCREGSIENEMDNGVYSYLEAGDLSVDIRKYHAGYVNFPVKHFHGVSVGFYLPDAEKQIRVEFRNFSVYLSTLQHKFCKDDKPYIIKASEEIEHIFSELYKVPSKIRKDYFRIKIFELLLYLDALEYDDQSMEKPYFYKNQVEKVKAIQKLITENMLKHYTIEELSEKFDMSQTALKTCFKTVYGRPIFSYMQNYRINMAATMLKKGEKKVSEIAGDVGYESQSKFTSAFKKIMGITPLEYRNKGKERQ